MAADRSAPEPDAPDADLAPRDVRAATQPMDLVRDAPDLFLVYHDGSEYVVDPTAPACTCADWEHREPAGGCKHARRVRFATGAREVPPALDADPQLGRQQARYGPDR